MGIDEQAERRALAALHALADLTPTGERRDEAYIVPLEWFRWLDSGLSLFERDALPDPGVKGPSLRDVWIRSAEDPPISLAIDRRLGEQLAAVQQVRAGRHAVRVGWLWVAGTAAIANSKGAPTRRRVFLPLVSRTVRVVETPGRLGYQLMPYGDPELTDLIADREVAQRLEEHIELGGGAFTRLDDISATLIDRLPRLKSFARSCAAAAGIPATELTVVHEQPESAMRADGVRIVVGAALYTTEQAPGRSTRAGGLLAWPTLSEPTAFHAVYAGSGSTESTTSRATGVVESPLPLTPRQAETIGRARDDLLTVVSGAPGTGKSHTLVSIVCDSLRRGESVLVAAKNEAAVDALIDLLDRQPGIVPVVFGSNERRAKLAQRLANGELRPSSDEELRSAEHDLHTAIAARNAARSQARRSLRAEWLATVAGSGDLDEARRTAPSASTVAPSRLAELMVGCVDASPGWRRRRRRARAERELRRRVGAPAGTELTAILHAIEMVGPTATADSGGCAPDEACTRLDEAERNVRLRLAAWLALETCSSDRLDRSGLAAVGTLATALRSGRSARRAQLERLRDRTLTRALPVWMGTLGDVDDLLPPVAGMFDVVLIDEASSTEQTAAAPALLRARRAVVVGDPRQLRHVSFISDAAIEAALTAHDVEPADRAQLDVRRNSLFDAAASASPVVMLDEHFRSAPHLIDVVARSLYGGKLHVATRNPISQSVDCVHLRSTSGSREVGGVVRAEIDSILTALTALRSTARSVGVITPFRAQADALDAAVLASFDTADLVRMDLRVGTVHSFQGIERDIVLCSLGLVDGDAAGWAFVADPHLLAVMLTRARSAMTIVSSCNPDPTSMLGQYIAAADAPPGPPSASTRLDGWAASVIADLRLAGVDVSEAYPAGRHVIDGATVANGVPVAITCELHPDGVDAHIDRQLALGRAGWRTVGALRSDWGDDAPERIVDLARSLRSAG